MTRAEDVLRQIIRLNPLNAEARHNLKVLLAKQGRSLEAEEAVEPNRKIPLAETDNGTQGVLSNDNGNRSVSTTEIAREPEPEPCLAAG